LQTGKTWLYRADDIFVMLRNDGLSHPHFDEYKEFVSHNAKELRQKFYDEVEKIRLNPLNAERDRKQKELDIIVNKTKASSRIEKLKNKNNISKNTV
jgi:hypothetical protein